MDKSLLIDIIRENPPLWDQRDKRYHNRDIKSLLWKDIGDKMGVSVEQAKKQWELLRDTFRREFKKVNATQSGQEADDEYIEADCKWPYFKYMLFLKDVLLPRKTATNIPSASSSRDLLDASSRNSPNSEVSAINAENVTSQDVVETDSEIIDKVSEKPKRKRNSFQDEVINIEKKKVKLFEQKLRARACPQNQEDDDDMHFFKSILPHIRKFTDVQKMKVRMEFINIISRELQNINQGTYQNDSNLLSTSTPASSRCSSRIHYILTPTHEETQSSSITINDEPEEPNQPHSQTSSDLQNYIANLELLGS
ncbi:transcription factor Adf-1-like [Onthophagus taurus]|uniref:transcription factor Adf-1-like n=1 Tax=Onthophagus taurus TaxID=166361 RepID=UPI0039BE798E